MQGVVECFRSILRATVIHSSSINFRLDRTKPVSTSFVFTRILQTKVEKKNALKPSSSVNHKREKSILDDCVSLKQGSLKIVSVTRNFTFLL